MANAKYAEFVNKLSSLTGLHTDVLYAWVAREQGVNNNILGLTYQKGSSVAVGQYIHGNTYLGKFPSQTAAAVETARWINTLPQYKPIKATAGGTSAQQALAIAQSPWHKRPPAGGVDPYYYAGFVKAGILTGPASVAASKPSGGTSTPIAPSPNASNANTTQSLLEYIGKSGQGLTPHLEQGDIDKIIAYFKLRGFPEGKTESSVRTELQPLVTKSFTQLPNYVLSAGAHEGIPGVDITVPNIDVGGALMFVAIILVGIAFLFLGGFIILKQPKGAPA